MVLKQACFINISQDKQGISSRNIVGQLFAQPSNCYKLRILRLTNFFLSWDVTNFLKSGPFENSSYVEVVWKIR